VVQWHSACPCLAYMRLWLHICNIYTKTLVKWQKSARHSTPSYSGGWGRRITWAHETSLGNIVIGPPSKKRDKCPPQKKRETNAGCWWLTPVILRTTQEAEIRRITVQSQPGQRVCEILSWKKTYHRAVGVAHVVECLPSKCKSLSSNSSIAKEKKGWWSGSRFRPWV
jgi:hypothetical protein